MSASSRPQANLSSGTNASTSTSTSNSNGTRIGGATSSGNDGDASSRRKPSSGQGPVTSAGDDGDNHDVATTKNPVQALTTTLKPPRPYAEDAVDEDGAAHHGTQLVTSEPGSSALQQEDEHSRDVAAVAAAAAVAASEQDEDEARSLETQMRLAKGHRDAMNAVMQLAQAARDAASQNGQHSMPPQLQAQLQAQQRKGLTNSAGATATGKRKRTSAQQEEHTEGASDEKTEDGMDQFQWSPEAQETFARLFGNVSGIAGAKKRAGDANHARGKDVAEGAKSDPRPDQEQSRSVASLDTPQQDAAGSSTDADLSAQADAEDSAELLARNGRALNPSKRAAQNRAAQRAFRMRRDEHVREIESKAKRTDEAERDAKESRRRLDDALQTIEALRADNHSLRVAIEAVGIRAPMPSQVTSALHTAEPKHNTEKAATELATAIGGGAEAGANGTAGGHHNQAQITSTTADASDKDELGGLSAVAAAAAAAAAMGQAQGDGAESAQQS